MSMSIPEIEDAKLLFVFGYNGADSHPVVARRIVKAKQKGAKIIVCDPRITETARIADIHLQLKGGTNMALINAIAHVIIDEGITDNKFIEERTCGYEDYKKLVERYTPDYAEAITRVPAETIRRAAIEYAKAETSMILYGMGVTQFSQAVDVVKTLANLALMTGNFGKLNCGVGPVRGQNNVQGACDMGALPNVFPGYQLVADEEVRKKFEKAWGVSNLPSHVGTMLTRVPDRILKERDESKKLRAYYIMGEDPAQSDPNLHEVREALEKLDFIVVQDIFMNKTALFADVILPATSWGEHDGVYTCADRSFQRIRKAIEPKGDVKTDWDIICQISTAMGYPMKYNNTKEIWDEIRELCPDFKGATYEKIEKLGGVQWPCRDESMEDTGTKFLHKGTFATASGKANFFAAEWRPPLEETDNEYPYSLSTVREVGHYSARTMTGNCRLLRDLEDEPGYIQMNPKDCERLRVKEGELVRIKSKRSSTISRILPTERVKEGSTYMTYQWWIGSCNELTSSHLDPISQTPEYKYCAVNIEKIDDQIWAEKYIKDTYDDLRIKMRINPEKGCADE